MHVVFFSFKRTEMKLLHRGKKLMIGTSESPGRTGGRESSKCQTTGDQGRSPRTGAVGYLRTAKFAEL